MTRYPKAQDLMEAIEHCSQCGESNPDETGDGESACCGARVCRPDGTAQDVCCAAVTARMEEEARHGKPSRAAGRPYAPPAARPPARKARKNRSPAAHPAGSETGGLQSESDDANLMSHPGGNAPTPEDTEEPAMATTRYTVAATASHPEAKIISNLRSARAEADARARMDRVDVEVTTVATGKVTYTAKGAPLTPAPAEPVQQDTQDDAQDAQPQAPAPVPADDAAADDEQSGTQEAPALHTPVTAAEFDIAVGRSAPPAAPAKKAAAPRKARRATLGSASADGWELLYDKPKQNCEVGRNAAGQYALICKTHQHVHPVTRLTQERTIRANGGWCPQCTGK